MNADPGHSRKTNASRRDDRILEAATKLFSEKGFSATRMADVAARAEVAVGTIYLRFPNKQALLAGLFDRFEERFATAMMAPEIHATPWPDRFGLMFSAILQTAADIPELPAIMRLATHAHNEEWQPGQRIREAIAGIVREAQSTGSFRRGLDGDVVASVAHGMVDGVMQHLMRTPETDPRGIVAVLADACTRWLIDPDDLRPCRET